MVIVGYEYNPTRKHVLIASGAVLLVSIIVIIGVTDSDEKVLAEEFEDHMEETQEFYTVLCDEPEEVAMNRSFHCDVRWKDDFTGWQQDTILITLEDEDGYEYRWGYVEGGSRNK